MKETQNAQKKPPAQVTAKTSKDGEFPELKNLSYKEMYNIVGKFIQKTIPIKGAKLTIVKSFNNRVATPKPPYVVLQIIDENQISTIETRYTDKHKILWAKSEVTMSMSFVGTGNIAALQMAKSFVVRFNDAWASEQFAQHSDIFFPLYCKDVRIEKFAVNAEDQYDDSSSVTAFFEYHPEFGVCEDSAKEIVMSVLNAEVEDEI